MHRAIVESVLLYNCGTWALTQALADKLDRFQPRILRHVLGLKWFNKVTNVDLYNRCGIAAASTQVLNARWRLFGILFAWMKSRLLGQLWRTICWRHAR